MANKITSALIALSIAAGSTAQNTAGGTDAYIRENPNLGEQTVDSVKDSDDKYPFINRRANVIEFNDADWSAIRSKIADAANRQVSIVLVGDSHIQAEGSTTPTRLVLQKRYGSAGRGLIIPFKLAGTNQPFDYSVTSTSNMVGAKLLKKPWPTYMGFTGISLEPQTDAFNFSIALTKKDSVEVAFNRVRVLYHGATPIVTKVQETGDDMEMYFEADYLPREIVINLPEDLEKVTIDLKSPGKCNILGFVLENGHNGIMYSAIGNNGATYGTYNGVGTEGEDLASLNPDLVIISLGANESFGDISDEAFYETIDTLVNDIQAHNPQAPILLTTPNETHKKNKAGVHQVNVDSKRLRDVILRYGRDNNIATYDFFAIAGGEGSSHDWLRAELMRGDRIHHSWAGYTLQGDLLYQALVKAFEP